MVCPKIFGTPVKTRTLIRKHGWTAVDVSANEIKWDSWYGRQVDKENRDHYKEIVEWCENIVGKENYACTLQNGGGSHNVKRFIFKKSKHATMFRMKWC
jgi:hypothetical protein